MEDHPTGRPITSLSPAGTGALGTISNRITPPTAQAPPTIGLKQKHGDTTESGNLWSETRLRPGHGIRLLRLYGGASDAPLQGRLILSDGKETYEALSYARESKESNSPISIFSAGSTYTWQ
jgi:hypothetical protein